AAARAASDGVVIVVPDADVTDVADSFDDDGVVVVAGGESRADSVRSGVAVIPESADVILVHDAARPAVSAKVFSRVIRAVAAHIGGVAGVRPGPSVGVVPVVAVTDSLRRPGDGAVDRSELRAVQTPQGFPAAAL